MNILLRFKQEKYSQAYSQDTQLHFQKRVAFMLLFTTLSLGGYCISFAANQNTYSTVSKWLSGARLVLMSATVLCLFCLSRIRLKTARYAKCVSICLDIFFIFLLFISYPLTGSAVIDTFEKSGVFVIAWCSGIGSFAMYFIIANWWVRVLVPIIQIIYFLSFAVMRESDSEIIVLVAIESVVLFLFYNYFNEKQQRKTFLEQRKLHENSETIKSILDDISQGIMIIDQQTNLVYANRTVNRMFGGSREIYSVNSLFSELHVKSILPRMESLTTEQISTSQDQDDEEYQNTLNELTQMIFSTLLHSISPEPSVIAETAWWDLADPKHTKKNLSVKFTTADYMGARVIVVNFTDTTDRDSLVAARISLDQKIHLLSSVSHELRTPLNGSINFINETLQDEGIPQKAKEKWLVPALRCNRLLLSLVNDILDFSQMRVGKLRLVREPRNIVETARECVELLEIQASKKDLKLKLFNNLPLDSEILTTDHNRLRQVMLNLLSNAVKFTFNGGVSLILDPISVKLHSESILKGVRVTCRDTGIGISAENQKKLFRAFEKIELGTRAPINAMGAGLGLLISNNLVQRLCPREITSKESKIIGFESQEDVGTSFHFEVYDWPDGATSADLLLDLENRVTDDRFDILSEKGVEMRNIEELNRELLHHSNTMLTFRQSRHITISGRLVSLRSDNLILSKISTATHLICKCPRILVVDDDAFNQIALEEILYKLQLSCHLAFNGREAIQKIKMRQTNRCCSSCQQYKVIFLDCSMPVLDGFETSRILKQMMKNGEIDEFKIIACTAAVQNSDEVEAKAAGMDEFCTKPIMLHSVREKLSAVGFPVKSP